MSNTPLIEVKDLKQHFIAALSKLLTDRTTLLEDGRLILKELLDTATLDADSESLLQEMDVVAGMIRQMVNENANQATDQTAYADRYNSLVDICGYKRSACQEKRTKNCQNSSSSSCR